MKYKRKANLVVTINVEQDDYNDEPFYTEVSKMLRQLADENDKQRGPMYLSQLSGDQRTFGSIAVKRDIIIDEDGNELATEKV